ncbi:MAG: hypothetical protein NTZ70_09265 [Methylococcales bacterium]|nr:hypothetical protein [Methylococcales bacterium]
MKLLKNAVVATTLVLSLGAFSTTANAICLGMACMYNRMTPVEGIDATLGQCAVSLKSIGDNADKEVIVTNIKEALSLSKEINANDKVDRNRNRANGDLKKARESVQNGDLALATEQLKDAQKRFSELKGMIDLTLDDRESQQTHMLNRIMNTSDEKAGSRK